MYQLIPIGLDGPGHECLLRIGKSLAHFTGGLHILLAAPHDASVLSVTQLLRPEIPNALVEAHLGHDIVGFEEGTERLENGKK